MWNTRTGRESFGKATNVNLAIFLFVFLNCSLKFLPCTAQCITGKPCFPSAKDISAERNVIVNSTCGDPAERFCVELDCSFECDSNDNTSKHPASYINDGFSEPTYWKSKNFDYPVFMQLDLGSLYMFFRSTVTFQHDYHLPSAMYFAKSKDFGSSFQTVAFFAVDCRRSYNMTETNVNERNGLQVQCFKIDTNPNPLSRTKQIEYGPLQDSSTSKLLYDNITSSEIISKLFLLTNIRVMLEAFIMPPGKTVDTVSESAKRGLYFSVKDWNVRVACYCYGQALKCSSDNSSTCVCERNTRPPHCNMCQPLYNNRTWKFGEQCEACGCNNHSLGCVYNATKGYGVCLNCTHNTMGEKCQSCKPYYFRNPSVAINHNETCLACACNADGVSNESDSRQCNPITGQCNCKLNVQGRTCGLCKPGYWNLSSTHPDGCQECRCVTQRTLNNSNICDGRTGQCNCKPGITGLHCTRCQDGYFGLTADKPNTCDKCACSSVGSVNISCNSTGGCYCRPNFYGLKCDQIRIGFYVPSVAELTSEAEDAVISPPQERKINYTSITDTAGRNVLVVGVTLSAGKNSTTSTKLSFFVNVPYTGVYTTVLRFMTNSNWKSIKVTSLLRTVFSNFSCDDGRTEHTSNEVIIQSTNITAGNEFAVFGSSGQCMLKGEYKIDVEIQFTSGDHVDSLITVDSIVLLPFVTQWKEYKRATTEEKQNMTFYYRQALGLRQWSGSAAEGRRALAPFFGVMYGKALACSCDSNGSKSLLCKEYGGQCDCKPNVIGRQCNKCQPDHYNFASGAGCTACSCDAVGSNQTSCDLTSGQCSCYEGVIGRTCNTCQQFYYNFSSGVGCSPCNCNPLYSQDLQCNETGRCNCKSGVDENKCTRCADNYYNLTTAACSPCDCDLSGSLNSVCNKTTGQCVCRMHAQSRQCSSCEYGYYGLNSRNPAGCLKCHCSGKSNNCSTGSGWELTAAMTKLLVNADATRMDGWMVVDGTFSQIRTVDYYWDYCASLGLDMMQGCIVLNDGGRYPELYFSAPSKYLGDKRFAYTYRMTFLLQFDSYNDPLNSTKGDVILTGKSFNHVLVTSFSRKPGTMFSRFEVDLVESQWRVGDTNGRLPTSGEMVAVLSSLTAIYIRAKWSMDTPKRSRITDIQLYYSGRTTVLNVRENTTNVETCQCPAQYKGQFCEQCVTGYTRVTPNGGAYVDCVPCQCNGHSLHCLQETGVCQHCQRNTTGDYCERCADGFYGNATHGTSHDCKKCPCPGPDDQFARTCRLDSDGQPTCNCFPGYDGRRCNVCADGYYGRPWERGGSCKKCNCSGNVDANVQGNCNRTTGECLKCLKNTTGFNCQWCKAGYHGNALTNTCRSCNCTTLGSKNNECHNVTGQCQCWPNVAGMTCDQCEVNAFNYTSGRGCTKCSCHPQGAILQQCNETTGECTCHGNVTGKKCDSCYEGYFDVARRCVECNCHPNQTVPGTTCNVETGQCVCNFSLGGGKYGGRQCEGCALHTTGKPPYCKPCTERCYFNWWKHINTESHVVSILEKNVTDLLQEFGGMSRDTINSTLYELDQNLTSANQVFSGAQYNLQDKTDQLNKIRTSILEYQRRLNESQQILKDANSYLTTVVDKFNGTIEVTPTAPVQYPAAPSVQPGGVGVRVYADYETIVSMATSYKNLVSGYNSSSYESFGRIMNSYDMIALANTTATIAARQIEEAMATLPQIDAQRRVAKTNLGPSFQESLNASQRKLEEISQVTRLLSELLINTSVAGRQAKEMVDSANSTIDTAQKMADQRRNEAKMAFDNATAAQRKMLTAQKRALEVQDNVTEFKSNATVFLAQAQSSLDKVVEGLNRVTIATNITTDANKFSAEVLAMNLSVSLEEIQRLANEINSTEVNETAINITYEGASSGLAQAREVEQLSKKAINVSQNALNTVKGIENSLSESERLVQEARSLQTDTDRKADAIDNINSTVHYQFSSATKVGHETIQLVNNTIELADDGLRCFADAKRVAQNASKMARKAYNVSQEAKTIFDESNKKIPNATKLVDDAYNIAKSSFSDIEGTHANATDLLQNVMEAEVLLKSYLEQREEMMELKTEVENLERELNNVTLQFEQALEKYNNCNS